MECENFRHKLEDKKYALELLEKVREQTQLCREKPTEENFNWLKQLEHDLYGAIALL